MTQKELGEKLGGIPQQQIGRWENGKSNPKLNTIQKIAAALSVNINDLVLITNILACEVFFLRTFIFSSVKKC